MSYPVESVDEPLYSMLVSVGLTEVTAEDYNVLAASDMETVQQYVDAAVADPESYPWESIIYTLREAQGGDAGAAGGDETAAAGGGEMYSVEQVDEPLYSMLVSLGLAEVSAEDYNVLAASDMETVQQYVDAAVADPESYPWESIIYTLKEAQGGDAAAEDVGDAAAEEAPEDGVEEVLEEGGIEDYAEGGDDEEEEVEHEELEGLPTDGADDAPPPPDAATNEDVPENAWVCTRCTFVNKNPDTTVCQVCRASRNCEFEGKGFVERNAEGKTQLIISSADVPKSGSLRGQFKVMKYNSDSLLAAGNKKERVFEIDFFTREFKNCDTNGKASFALNAANLYRVERHLDNPKALKLLFFKASHPIDLIFPTGAMRQRFMELAALQRRNPIVWAPSLCRENVKESIVRIEGSQIDMSGTKTKVDGSGTFNATRMPYEALRLWTGSLNLQNRGLPANNPKLEEFLPPTHDLYFIGLQDLPKNLMDGKQIADFFTEFFGQNFYVLLNTAAETNTFAGIEGRRGDKHPPAAIVIVVRRTTLVKVSNIDYIDIVDDGAKKKEAADMYAVFACLRVQDSYIGVCLINLAPNLPDVNVRNAKIQAVINKVKCGNPGVDFSVRFDYLFCLGSWGYPTVPVDELHSQIAGQVILTDFQECTILQEMCLADRVLFWHRPRSCKATILQYSTAPHLGMPNIQALFDLFVLRPYIYALSPDVPPIKISISQCKFICDTLPTVKDPEVRIHADWFEDPPVTVPLKFKTGKYVCDACPPLVPVCPAYEWLRSQSVMFSLYGQAEGITKKKDLIASSVIPLRDLLIPDEPLTHSVFVMRQTTVIGILETSVTYVTRK